MRFSSFQIIITGLCGLVMHLKATDAVHIPKGTFQPQFSANTKNVEMLVRDFWMDRYPVTESNYREFIQKNTEWAKQQVSPLFADQNYLKGLGATLSTQTAQLPIQYVSWFAASAYCQAQGGRLPTVLEWEYVAAASEKKKNALKELEFNKAILSWYAQPGNVSIKPIGQGKPNWYGVHDLHGLIWEWTADFNSVFVSGDSRQNGDRNNALTCGAGGMNASDRENYAAFMRFAMRNSLSPTFAQPLLGFRCVYEHEPASIHP